MAFELIGYTGRRHADDPNLIWEAVTAGGRLLTLPPADQARHIAEMAETIEDELFTRSNTKAAAFRWLVRIREDDRCVGCGNQIVWALTEASGRSIPLEADPVPDGNLVYVDAFRVAVETPLFDGDPLRFVSHFARCPEADNLRRRR